MAALTGLFCPPLARPTAPAARGRRVAVTSTVTVSQRHAEAAGGHAGPNTLEARRRAYQANDRRPGGQYSVLSVSARHGRGPNHARPQPESWLGPGTRGPACVTVTTVIMTATNTAVSVGSESPPGRGRRGRRGREPEPESRARAESEADHQ